MTYRRLLKKLKLTQENFEEIKQAVAGQEVNTSGEIALAIAPESGHYSFWELLYSNIIAAIVSILFLPMSNKVLAVYESIYWNNVPTWLLPSFFLVSYFAVVIICFYLANIPFIDRVIIPNSVKKATVSHRAVRYFSESGVYQTKSNSGILIFVSYLERQVRIIADTGISEKISQDMWNLIADELSEEMKRGNTKSAFINAINKCGTLLAENFPPEEDNPNELPDGLVILGDREWN